MNAGELLKHEQEIIRLMKRDGDSVKQQLAAAQATIEKQRKVIKTLVKIVILVELGADCCTCCINKCDTEPDADGQCVPGIVAYAEKQVEEGK